VPANILVKGSRVHNLKNIDVEIPRERLVVITGVSGSGKSSLAFDTLYAEGQRRYVESLSAYARQFLELMERPDVDSIEGLSPAISIEQKSASRNPRSTVGTVTEIYDYLRLLFARIGNPFCYRCGQQISVQTIQQIVDRILTLPANTRIHILAPVAVGRKGEYRRQLKDLAEAGFSRVKIDGRLENLADEIMLRKTVYHDIDLVVDRLVVKADIRKRLADSLEVASRYGSEVIKIEVFADGDKGDAEEILFSQKLACVRCGISYPEFTPRMFSFNSPYGACSRCSGLGIKLDIDLIYDPDCFANAPLCSACGGARLKKESLQVKISGKNIAEVTALSLEDSLEFFRTLKLSAQEEVIARRVVKEITDRLEFLVAVGLGYLTLGRSAATLSGGEGQRIRLATQIGSGLAGVLYILDEPSVGLHPRDHARLLDILKRLRDLGNTVLVVEHDRDTILAADHIIDMGPGAGVHGGWLIAQGTPQQFIKDEGKHSLTGDYLAGRKRIPTPTRRRKGNGMTLTLSGARHNNLKNLTVSIPAATLTCVTGVSGSGKSSLIVDTLYPAMAQRLRQSNARAGALEDLSGWKNFEKVININQNPIGRTPRSNPATYTGVLLHIRDLFAQLPEARVRGYRPGRFSFNAKGGRCEACQGDGVIRVEMQFLPDVFVTCEVCHGSRYNRETLEVLYKGLTIADILQMTVIQALDLLGNFPAIRRKLETLRDVGLGYITLGQSATTLSGGEAQRIKLSRELSKRSAGRNLYILDEPTTGLHFDDIKKLLEVLRDLTNLGNTVIVIEHNLDVIKSADYVIDLGPEGGERGGHIVAQGTPEEIANNAKSHTGIFLKSLLNVQQDAVLLPLQLSPS
jgi:excinuclease ABC subunit A